MNIKKILYGVCMMGVVAMPFVAMGQSTIPPAGGGSTIPPVGTPASAPAPTTINVSIKNPFKGGDTLESIVVAILDNIIKPLAAVLVVIMIIYSGFKFVIAQGNSTEIGKAKDGLLWVLVGTLVLLGASAIAEAIKGTLQQFITF